ncbi:hypothetical protein LIA77_08057 [Sarocladium implicatum]|nr:hypothetical protein LIA77_08057 [Sarocladium implicatum]
MAPDFSDRARFPTFTTLPLANASSDPNSDSSHYLIGQVKENMTITNPTLIITDLTGLDLAVTFASSTFDLSPFRKGRTCIVIPGAERTAPAEEGKKGFVRVPEGREEGVRCLPGKLEVLKREREGNGCWAEGCEEEGELKCLGCGLARYSGKECQVKGWSEGHKGECKMLKAVNEIWDD